MEPSSIVLITAPILFPVAVALGIHPVHLGILMTVNMEVGLCHPPVGLNLYVASGIAKMGITELTIAVWPWLADHAGVPGDRDLRPRTVALAAARPWDALGRKQRDATSFGIALQDATVRETPYCKGTLVQLTLLRRSLLAAGLALIATAAPAQEYPNKPITLMVGLAAGGITDVTARLYAEAVSKTIGQRVTIENKTGAGGGVAAAAVQNAAPDGYTLLVFSGSQHATVPAVGNAAYEPVKGFSPITYLFNSVVVLTVPADSPAKTMKELHELGPQEAGRLDCRHAGPRLAVASARRQDFPRRQGAGRRWCTIAAARR